MSRLETTFDALKKQGKTAFIPYIMAGDPDYDTTLSLMLEIVNHAHVDVIELGMAFTDPMADGPAIQEAATRALTNGARLSKTLELVKKFREKEKNTPIVLMGYFNPIHKFGLDAFLKAAQDAGIDGILVADLPVEEDHGFAANAKKHNIDVIQLVAPTTPEERLNKVLKNAGGFVYYVSVTGVTGTTSALKQDVQKNIEKIQKYTTLPIGIGFGISSPDQSYEMAQIGDAVIVGSAIVKKIKENLDEGSIAKPDLVKNVSKFVKTLSDAAHK